MKEIKRKGKDITAPTCGGGGQSFHMGESADRQEHLGQFRVDMILTELGHVREGKKENEVQQSRGQRYKIEGNQNN